MDNIIRLSSRSEYQAYVEQNQALQLYKLRVIDLLTQGVRGTKRLPGFSVTADRLVDFTIDTNLVLPDGSYNLRETVNCPETGFNMRMRAAIHAITDCENSAAGPVYLCEQKTPMFTYFNEYFTDLVGSEYLGESIALGATDADGLRNEDATQLTFEDNSFNQVISFEVLEHIPDFNAALQETHRVLRPGGRFYFTAPFNPHTQDHLIRAKIEDGELIHILEPEMHGDPVTGEGILCFQHFGWEIVKDLNAAGFRSIEALLFDGAEYGYYTQDPIIVFRAIAGDKES